MNWTHDLEMLSPAGRAVRFILLGALLLGVLACEPLWRSAREYPLVPLSSWFPSPGAPWDFGVLILLVVLIFAAVFFWDLALFVLLPLLVYLALADQTRLQPWLYLYWVLLLLNLQAEKPALAMSRIVVSGVYIWSGVQKLNPGYESLIAPFFKEAGLKLFPAWTLGAWNGVIGAVPWIEIGLGVALWLPWLRPLAVLGLSGMHVLVLLALSPFAQKHNLIVWPWNLAMIGLVVALFGRLDYGELWAGLKKTRWGGLVALAVCALPWWSFAGRWDSYLSFSLYSGNLATADIYVSPAFKAYAPAQLTNFIVQLRIPPEQYDQQIQAPYVFDHQTWCEKSVQVVPLPEPRGFLAVARAVARHARQPQDVRMVLAPRGGPALWYQAPDILAGKPAPWPAGTEPK